MHSSISSPSEPNPDSRQRSSKSNVPSVGHISQSYSETPQPSPIVQQQSDLVTYKIQLKRYFFSLPSQLVNKYLLIIDSRFIFITSIFSDVVESPPSIPSPLPAPSKTSNCLKVENSIADDIFLIMMLIIFVCLLYSCQFYLQSPPITLLKHMPSLRSMQLVLSAEVS